jgi:hypothetical protein
MAGIEKTCICRYGHARKTQYLCASESRF